MRMHAGKVLAIAILATALGRFAYGVCCSAVVLHPEVHWNQLTRYIVTDRWAYCTTGGQITVWIAENAFIAHAWIQAAENNGHCVLY